MFPNLSKGISYFCNSNKSKAKCNPKENVSEIISGAFQMLKTHITPSTPPQNFSNPVKKGNEVIYFA
jgi:hypothetical protein